MVLKFAFLQVMILFYCLDLVSNKLFLTTAKKKIMCWGLPCMDTLVEGWEGMQSTTDSGTQVSSKSRLIYWGYGQASYTPSQWPLDPGWLCCVCLPSLASPSAVSGCSQALGWLTENVPAMHAHVGWFVQYSCSLARLAVSPPTMLF